MTCQKSQRTRDLRNGYCHPVVVTWSPQHPPSIVFFSFLEHIAGISSCLFHLMRYFTPDQCSINPTLERWGPGCPTPLCSHSMENLDMVCGPCSSLDQEQLCANTQVPMLQGGGPFSPGWPGRSKSASGE